MNTETNSYTIIYATVMVVLAAVLLAGAAVGLRDGQKANERIDKMEQILRSLGQSADQKGAVPTLYSQVIKKSLIINANGEVVSEVSSDQLAGEADEAFSKDATALVAEGKYPLFVADFGGKDSYVIPLNGAGLWNKIWGYIAIDATDGSTVLGVDFGNAGETPGLGAEMSTPMFADRFSGKQVFKNGQFKSIAVVKPGTVLADQDYVDGLSGGTLTSNGVHDMLKNGLAPYKSFLEQHNVK